MCFFCFKISNSCWGKHGKNSENSRKNVKRKNCQKFERKKSLLMNKNLKLVLIIPTLNTKKVLTSNLFEIF
jgi:hypothetical protein